MHETSDSRHERRSDGHDLTDHLGRSAAARRAVGVERFDFAADLLRLGRRGRSRGNPDPHLVRLRRDRRDLAAVQRADADHIGSDVRGGEAQTGEPLLDNPRGQSRASHGAGPCVRDLPLADVAVTKPERDLQRLGPGPPAGAVQRDAILRQLRHPHAADCCAQPSRSLPAAPARGRGTRSRRYRPSCSACVFTSLYRRLQNSYIRTKPRQYHRLRKVHASMRSLIRVAVGVALVVFAVVSASTAFGSHAASSFGKQRTVCRDSGWPSSAQGVPAALRGTAQGYFLWHDVRGWHLRLRAGSTGKLEGNVSANARIRVLGSTPAARLGLKAGASGFSFQLSGTGKGEGIDFAAACARRLTLNFGGSPASGAVASGEPIPAGYTSPTTVFLGARDPAPAASFKLIRPAATGVEGDILVGPDVPVCPSTGARRASTCRASFGSRPRLRREVALAASSSRWCRPMRKATSRLRSRRATICWPWSKTILGFPFRSLR